MRQYTKIAAMAAIMFISVPFMAYSQAWMEGLSVSQRQDFYEVNRAFEEYWEGREIEKGHGWKQFKRWQWFWEQRIGQDGKFPSGAEIYGSWQNFRQKYDYDSPLNVMADWQELGPVNVPQNMLYYQSSGLGRINCVEFHPVDPRIYWVGAASGGAWRTTDNGESWSVAPFTNFTSIGVTDIKIAPSNPDIIYIATGDANGSSMTNGYTIGIIKSTDAGDSWELTDFTREFNETTLIGEMMVHPDDPDVLIACTSEGIRKTTDGGHTWTQTSGGGYYRHLESRPDNSNILYASTFNTGGMCTIHKSTDFGDTWEQKYMVQNANRIELATSADNPDLVYALASKRYRNGFEGFYASTNSGENWELVSDSPNILSRNFDGSGTDGQGYYDLALAVSPIDSDVIFVGGINVWYSVDGGRNWNIRAHWTGSGNMPYVHADQHFFKYKGSTDELYATNDGGIYRTYDMGQSWEDISDGLAIHQFYRSGISEMGDQVLVGGTQDNGVQLFKNNKWMHVHGGDGMECLIDYKDPNYVYAENYYGSLVRSTNGGMSFRTILNTNMVGENAAWVTPFIIDPVDPTILYIGFENVYKTTDRGTNWEPLSDFAGSNTLRSLAVAPSNRDYLYAASRTILNRTTDGGTTWEQIFTAPKTISYIAVNPHDPGHLWLTLSGYTDGKKIYEYKDGEWNNISTNLPNIPINCIAVQRGTEQRLYIGTDIGVFYRDSNMEEWRPFNDNMPNVIINELEIHYPTGRLYATTFGRGIWYTEIIECNIEMPEISLTGKVEICEGESLDVSIAQDYYAYEWSSGEDTPSITITRSGEYFCSVTDSTGCRAFSESVFVTVSPVPNFTITAESGPPFCGISEVELKAPPIFFTEYEWSTGAKTRSITVNEPGEYIATGYTSAGCPARDTIVVEFYPAPEIPEIIRMGDSLISSQAAAYEWYRNGEIIESAADRVYILKEPGDYYVRTYDENGCPAESNIIEVKTSVVETAAGGISIVPNPGDGIYRINIHDAPVGEIRFSVVTLLGENVYSEKFMHSGGVFSRQIDIAGAPSGTYFLRAEIGGNIYTARIIRQ